MRLTLLIVLLLASAPALAEEPEERGEPAPEAVPPPGEGLAGDVTGEGKPPPGSPEDRALWADALDVSQRITLERTLATKLQWEARSDRFDERLGALAGRSSGSAAKDIEALRVQYRAALAHGYQILTRRWPVDPTRGCNYSMLHLASAMRTGKADELAVMRPPVQACIAKARPAVQAMAAANADLQRLAAAAGALFPAPPAAPPPAAEAAHAGPVAKD